MSLRVKFAWALGTIGLTMAAGNAWAAFPAVGCGNCHAVPTAGGSPDTCSPTFDAVKRQQMSTNAAIFGVTYTVDQINAEVAAQCGNGTTTSSNGTTTSTNGTTTSSNGATTSTNGTTTSTGGMTTSTGGMTTTTSQVTTTTMGCYVGYCGCYVYKPFYHYNHWYKAYRHGGKGGKNKGGRGH